MAVRRADAELRRQPPSAPPAGRVEDGIKGAGRCHADALLVAAASAIEIACKLPPTHELAHLPRGAQADLDGQVGEVKRMLYRFMQSLSSSG